MYILPLENKVPTNVKGATGKRQDELGIIMIISNYSSCNFSLQHTIHLTIGHFLSCIFFLSSAQGGCIPEGVVKRSEVRERDTGCFCSELIRIWSKLGIDHLGVQGSPYLFSLALFTLPMFFVAVVVLLFLFLSGIVLRCFEGWMYMCTWQMPGPF